MKLQSLLVALLVAGFAASYALAGPPPGKGPGESPTGACKPTVSFVIKGAVQSVAADSFSMTAAKGNAHFTRLKLANPLAVSVDDKTRFVGGKKKLADLAAGDKVVVQVRACRKVDAASFKLLARRVTTQAAQEAAESGDEGESAETTQTPTTQTPTTQPTSSATP